MPQSDQGKGPVVQGPAYSLPAGGGDPKNRAGETGRCDEPMEDEEKLLAGRHDVNMPALLTKDVPGG